MLPPMSSDEIQRALADISAETDPTLKLIAVALSGQVELDWQEARRLAERPEYSILPALEKPIRSSRQRSGPRHLPLVWPREIPESR